MTKTSLIVGRSVQLFRLSVVLVIAAGIFISGSEKVHAAAGDITAVRIMGPAEVVTDASSSCGVSATCNGWVAEIDISGLNPGGTYNFGLGTNNNPTNAKIAFTVVSPGYDTNGNATTVTRTVYGTQYVRAPFPLSNSTLNQPDEASNAGTLTIKVALSDFIYSGDTVTASIASGIYTNGTTSNPVTNLSVTNNSTYSYPTSVGRWAWVPYEVASSSSYLLESVIFNRFAEGGKPLAVVAYSCADQHNNHVYATTTAMTVSTRGGDVNAVLVYAVNMNISTLTDGDTVTCNFRAYPWVGNSTSILDSSAYSSDPNENLTPFVFIKASNYGSAYTVVDPVNGATWSSGYANVGSVQSSVETTYAADHTKSWKTIGDASQAIKSFNNATYGRNDAGGGTILLVAGNHDWPGAALATGANATWLSVTHLSTLGIGDAVITGDANALSLNAGNKMKVQGISITSTGIPFRGSYNSDHLWLDGDAINSTGAGFATIYNVRFNYITHNAITQFGPAIYAKFIRGNNDALIGGNNGTGYCNIGNNGISIDGSNSTGWGNGGQSPGDGGIYAFNTVYGINGAVGPGIAFGVSQGVALVQNVFERKDGAAAGALIWADGNATSSNNFIFWHNDIVGGRTNLGYTDGGGLSGVNLDKNWGRTNFSSVGNMFEQWNNKAEDFSEIGNGPISSITQANPGVITYTPTGAGPFPNGARIYFYGINGMTQLNGTTQTVASSTSTTFSIADTTAMSAYVSGGTVQSANPIRTGGWPVGYHVGARSLFDGASRLDNYSGEFYGLNSYTVGPNTLSCGFVSDQSYGMGCVGSSGLGGGNYHLASSSAPEIGLIPANQAVLPYDLDGKPRRNDGTGAAGAYEYYATSTLLTPTFSGITPTAAIASSSISSIGGSYGSNVTTDGFAWGTDTTYSLGTTTTTGSFGVSDFNNASTTLTCNTTYHIRAYAVNLGGTAYSSDGSFTTSSCANPPTLLTPTFSSITSTGATASSSISATGGANATVEGFAWGTNAMYSIGTTTSGGPFGVSDFSNASTTLSPGTIYHVRAYATNVGGTGYSSDGSFTTLTVAPTVTSTSAGSITSTGAQLVGNVTATGGTNIIQSGFAYGTANNLETVIATTTLGSQSGVTAFNQTISGLTRNTQYYWRAYAVNSAGTGYGTIQTFTTSVLVPTLTTSAASSVSTTTAAINASITDTGGADSTQSGFAYGTANDLETVIATTTLGVQAGLASFSSSLSNLTQNITYYFRPYAVNSAGTGYGTIQSFTTLQTTVPTVTTQVPTSITATGATGNGTITATGNENAISRGMVYGTTVAYGATTTSSGDFGTGAFTSSITSLTCNTAYHIAAYATNPINTAYGADAVFTTSPCVPTVTTDAASSVTYSGATLNGTITAVGIANPSDHGFAYGTDPTLVAAIATSTLGVQNGPASFGSEVSSLSANTVYYFRAYAVNTSGTSTGSIQSFTTGAVPVQTESFSGGSVSTAALLSILTPTARQEYMASATGSTVALNVQSLPVPGCPDGYSCVPLSSAVTAKSSVAQEFSQSLRIGEVAEDVRRLQIFLNSRGFVLAKNGPGSPGRETNFFGPLTKAALMKFQTVYGSEILEPLGLKIATGFFGPATQKVVNGLMR